MNNEVMDNKSSSSFQYLFVSQLMQNYESLRALFDDKEVIPNKSG